MSAKAKRADGPNFNALRAAYLTKRNLWLAAVDARGLDMYADEAEGGYVGRGKQRQRDELGRLFDAMEDARAAYFGGNE